MKYKILSNTKPEALENLVNEYLSEGWKMYGYPVMMHHNLCQAVTKGDAIRPARLKAKQEKRNANTKSD